jgi:hypothetical protein
MGNLKDEELEQLARAKIMEQKVTSTLNSIRKYMSRVQRGSVGSTLACCMAGPSSNPSVCLQVELEKVKKARLERERERQERLELEELEQRYGAISILA